MASNNDAGERYYCEALDCNRSYKNRTSLTSHVKGMHQARYTCLRCGRNLKDPSNLRRHQPRCSRASPEEKAKATLYSCAWPSCRYEGRKDNVARHQNTCGCRPEGNDAKPGPLKMSKEQKEQAELDLLFATIGENGAEEDLLARQGAPVPQFEVQDINGAYQAQVEEAPEAPLASTPLEAIGAQFQPRAYDNVASEAVVSTSGGTVWTPGNMENVAFSGHNDNYVLRAGQTNIGTANIFPRPASYDNVFPPAAGNDFQGHVTYGHVTYDYNAAGDMVMWPSEGTVSTLGGMENVAFLGHNNYVLPTGQSNIGTGDIFPAQAGYDNILLPSADNDFQGHVEYDYLAPNPAFGVPYGTDDYFWAGFTLNT